MKLQFKKTSVAAGIPALAAMLLGAVSTSYANPTIVGQQMTNPAINITPQLAPISPRYSIAVEAEALDSIEDINGDGFRDLIVGMQASDQVELRSGRTGAVLGVMIGPSGSQFGYDVASTGDLDGDGLEDILIGAPSDGANGQAYIYSSATSFPLRIWGPSTPSQSGAQYGWAVSRGGQLNGVGGEEVLVSSPFYAPTTGGSTVGLIEAVNVTPFFTTVLHTITGTGNYEEFGDSLVNLGDIDGDSIDDFAVGASRFFGPTGIVCQPGNIPGITRVYSGVSMNFAPGMEVLIASQIGASAADTFGFAVGAADIDDDGMNDLIVGATDFCPGNNAMSYVYQASNMSGGAVTGATHTINSPAPQQLHYGWAVSGVGNLRGQTSDEFVVTAPSVFGGNGNPGRAYLHNGRTGAVLARLSSPSATPSFGIDVTELDEINSLNFFAISDPGAGFVHVYVF